MEKVTLIVMLHVMSRTQNRVYTGAGDLLRGGEIYQRQDTQDETEEAQ